VVNSSLVWTMSMGLSSSMALTALVPAINCWMGTPTKCWVKKKMKMPIRRISMPVTAKTPS